MVGLSIVLENQKSVISKKTPQVISKTTMFVNHRFVRRSSGSHPPQPIYFPSSPFLDHCFLCHQKLLPGKDIYMYKGDRAFCSVDCRCRQIFMDEEETLKKDGCCSLAAIKPSTATPASASTYASTSAYHHRKAGRNSAGGFAY